MIRALLRMAVLLAFAMAAALWAARRWARQYPDLSLLALLFGIGAQGSCFAAMVAITLDHWAGMRAAEAARMRQEELH